MGGESGNTDGAATRKQRLNSRTGRREALLTIGSGLAVALAGCTGSSGGGTTTGTATSTGTATDTDTATATATATTTAATSPLQKQLSTVREATTKYRDVRKALADGFKPSGPFVPGQGWHFINPSRVQAAAKNGLSLTKPQVLTYNQEMKLGAVEWAVPKGATDGEPDLFSDGNAAAEEHWHTHEVATHVMAKPDGKRTNPKNLSLSELTTNDYWTEFHPPDRSIKPGDEVALNWGTPRGKEGSKESRIVDLVNTHPSLRTLHVWVYADNPEGVFAESNPEFSQL